MLPTVPSTGPRIKEHQMATAVSDLKVAHRSTWAAGDYAAVAELVDEAPSHELLSRIDLGPGLDVLDVATGTGNTAIRAAATGSRVVGLDLTPELLGTARRRADRAGVEVDWVVGDAEDLPYEDGSFDRVLSVFGVQFAPRHAVTAAELARVCAPGGQIGLVNWTPEGQVGEMLRTIGGYMPAPPAFASPPPRWGSEQHVRDLFEGGAFELEFARAHNEFTFASAEHYVAFFETYYGPMIKARERLSTTGDWESCRADLLALCERRNEATDGTLVMRSEFLVAVLRKRRF
jgi:ubiquinone/menaquinone biosynthesis C-methylase UbiE